MKTFVKLLFVMIVAYSIFEVQAVKPWNTQQQDVVQKYEVQVRKTDNIDERKSFKVTVRAKNFEEARSKAGEKYGYNRIKKITLKD